ncbi:hypothetical protein DPMN_053904 [Dreissena polymorpha]|uniref:Uncharacterized protein n=1 Tax=Dreissena polymorpha TaxID=45954 RepID=A0A9D4CPB7_DREPO|nr:hypothetical protein DPMN_053904 [Dreissena polymorpha]
MFKDLFLANVLQEVPVLQVPLIEAGHGFREESNGQTRGRVLHHERQGNPLSRTVLNSTGMAIKESREIPLQNCPRICATMLSKHYLSNTHRLMACDYIVYQTST